MPVTLPIDAGLKGSPFGVDITKGFMPNVRDPETDEWISQDELTRRLAERAQQNAQPPAPPTAPETPPESPSRPDVALADPNTADATTKLTGAVQTARRGPFAALADAADQGAQVTRDAQQADENRPPSNLGPVGDVAGSLRRFGKSVLGATAQSGAGVATLEEQARNKAIQDQIDSMGQDVVSRGVSKLERKATAPVEGPVGTVLGAAQNAVGDVAENAGTALGQGIFPSPITQQGGYAGPSEGAKKVGSVLRAGAESAIPRSPLDLTMTAAPFAGEATRVARGAVERAAATETGQAIREGLAAGESGMVRPMPGGITKAEATRRRNAFLSAPSSETGRAGVQLRQPAPFTEEMGYVGEGLQLSPEHLGLPPIDDIRGQLAALRKAPKGKTAQIGKLEAQLEARQAIEGKDAQGAFQQIADSYATQHGQTPAARAKIEELGRIHNDMLSPEDVGNFHPNALQEAPAGAEFDPLSHEIRSRGPQAPAATEGRIQPNTGALLADHPLPAAVADQWTLAQGDDASRDVMAARQALARRGISWRDPQPGTAFRGGPTTKPLPEIAQPMTGARLSLTTDTLQGPKTIRARELALPGYNGPGLAVAEQKGETFVYLKDSGDLLGHSRDPETAYRMAVNSVDQLRTQGIRLPGTETAAGELPKQPPPVMGSMQEEAFRGEQGGLQGGLEGVNATTAERYQPGLAEGAPAKSRLDQAIASYRSIVAEDEATIAATPDITESFVRDAGQHKEALARLEAAAANGGELRDIPDPLPPKLRARQDAILARTEAQIKADAVGEVAPVGTPAAHVNELDDLLAARASVKAGGRVAGPDLERRIVELGKRTPFDNADVIAARAEQAAQPPTRLINTPERLQLREQIANKLYGEGASQRGRIADIVLGPPAAGKSSALAGPLAKENGALVIDSDAAKEFLPEFQGGRFAGVVHGESDGIAANVLNRAVATGDNIVLPLVGKNQDKIAELGALLKRKGYQVRLHMVEIPPDEAARRAVERFGTTGRFVDPDYVLNEVDSHPRHTFDNLKGEDWVSGSQRVSNDVARGSRPATLETTFDRPAVSSGAAGPGINDAGRLPAGATEPGAANAGTPVADALSTVSNANTAATAVTPAGSGPGESIPGLAESLTPEGRAAILSRRAAGGPPSTISPEPALTDPHVVQPDGTRAPATPENIQQGVRRVLARPSGVRVQLTGATPEQIRDTIYGAVRNAKTLGGRTLFGNVEDQGVKDAVEATIADGRFQITHTGGRGRIAAVFKADDEPGALIKAVDDVASTHRPEAGVENVAASSEAPAAPGSTLPGHGVPPASTREAAQPAAARGVSETFKPTEGYVPTPAPKPGELAPAGATAEELANAQAEQRAAREATLADRRQPTAPAQPTLDYQGGAVPAGVEPAPATRSLAQQRLERGLENAGPPSGGMGGEGPTPPVKPPAGGVGQAGFPWKPGQNLGHAFLTAAADVLFGVPRALKFGFDQSAALRQGLWDSLAHPAITVAGAPERYLPSGELNPAFGRGRGKAIAEALVHPGQELSGIARSLSHPQGALVEQFKAFSRALLHATPEETDAVYARIGRRYGDLKASYTDAQGNVHPGLYKAERGAAASLTAREEQLASSILYHIPGLRRLMRASEDSFAMFLSKQRDDVFDNWIDTYRRLTGDMPSKAEANDISRWINIKSGRGELPQNWANAFTVPFTAPRLYAAQLERLPVIAPLMLHSAEVRKQMVYDWIAVFGSLSTGVALADLSGLGSVDTDFSHPSADFLKIRIGNHRIDPWGGYAQLARLSARLASGARAGAGGAVYDSSWKQELTNFALSKLAPTAALANDIISGHDFDHNELHWDFDSVKSEIQNLYAPLMFQDLIQGFKDDGLKGLAISAPTFLGLSVQTYPPGVAELRTKAAQAEGHADYASAPQSVKDKIDAEPNIAPLVAKLPASPYQQAKSAAMDPIMADQQRAEESFNAGTNDTLIQDLWHDQNEQRKGARAALEAAFTKSFSGRQKNQFDKALDGFYDPQLEVKRPDGSPDFDATEVKKQAYLDSLPQVQRDWINDFTDTAAKNKTPLRQEYLAYLDERKKLGYFDANVKPADQARLDREHPDQDVANWKFKHTTTSDNTLNSVEAVNKALALDLPNRTVKATLQNVGSLQRPVNQSEQSRQAFNDTQKLLNDYGAAKVKYQDVERQRLAQTNAAYAKPFDKLTTEQQSTIHANIGRSLQINSPKLDAAMAWWGASDTLNSQAAIAEYRKLQQQYGGAPAKEGATVKVAAGAR